MLNEARRDMADTVEHVGTIAMHLREAMEFAENGAIEDAAACVDDAHAEIAALKLQLIHIRDVSGRWAVWAERLAKVREGGAA